MNVSEYHDTVIDLGTGLPVRGTPVSVLSWPDGAPATIYTASGTALIGNSVTTNSHGFFQFYVPDGRYSLQYADGTLVPAIHVGPSSELVNGLVDGLTSVQQQMALSNGPTAFVAADPTNSDRTAAVNAAIQSLPNGGTVKLPQGSVNIAGVVQVDRAISVEGWGLNQTFISKNNASNTLFNVTTQAHVTFRDFRVDAGVTQTGGNYILVDPGGTLITYSTIYEDLSLNGAYVAINSRRGAAFRSNRVLIDHYGFAGYIVENRGAGDIGDSSITSGNLSNVGISTGTGIIQHSSGGLKILDTKVLGGATAYQLDLDSNSNYAPFPGTSILSIQSGTSFEQQAVSAIDFRRSSGTATFGLVNIQGVEMAFAPKGIVISDPANTTFANFVIQGNVFVLVANATGIDANGGTGLLVDGNIFVGGSNPNTTGIRKPTGMAVGPGNLFNGVTTNVVNV